jgi:hypothetical protein
VWNMTERRAPYITSEEIMPNYKTSKLEDEFFSQVNITGLPLPKSEHLFHPVRKWRFDFAWVSQLVAVEIEGGIWMSGRHTRGKGYEDDCYKYNEAALLGWKVLRFTPKMIRSGEALRYVEMALKTPIDTMVNMR